MYVEQLYTGCLAEAAYYIESNGEAAIVDPLREIEGYLALAKSRNAKIKYIFETHFHADFVSGHIDLAKATGATIVYGPNANPDYKVHIAADNEVFNIGDIKIKTLHTPGHTMESTTWLLIDETGKERAIFSGDALFIGDVGRPDLAVKTDLTIEQLAGHLYDSLRNKIMPLPDDIIVYPGHGAGSACGKNMSKETTDTLGNQKKYNYALQDMSKDEFIKSVTTGLGAPPQYFPKNALMNKQGYEPVSDVLERGNKPISVDEFEEIWKQGILVLDTRPHHQFETGYIPNTLSIGLDGNFAMWVGALIYDIKQPIAVITEPGRELEAVMRLSRVGYDHCIGHLKGGFDAWKSAGKPIDTIHFIHPVELEKIYHNNPDIRIIDVRKPGEYEAEHVENAISYPLDYIMENLDFLSRDKKYYLHCAAGYRSMMAITILKNNGYDGDLLINVDGGFDEIKSSELPTTAYVCPTTVA
jgi:hydroxyacylglutathione hydrolase